MSNKLDEQALEFWEGMFGNAAYVTFGDYTVSYKDFIKKFSTYTSEVEREARIDELNRRVKAEDDISTPELPYAFSARQWRDIRIKDLTQNGEHDG